MNNDKMRAEFEEWAKPHTYTLKMLDGEYTSLSTQLLWQCWKASRAALVVELPDICDLHPRKMLEKEVIKRLYTAGVAYK
jgi:hypothetical protein